MCLHWIGMPSVGEMLFKCMVCNTTGKPELVPTLHYCTALYRRLPTESRRLTKGPRCLSPANRYPQHYTNDPFHMLWKMFVDALFCFYHLNQNKLNHKSFFYHPCYVRLQQTCFFLHHGLKPVYLRSFHSASLPLVTPLALAPDLLETVMQRASTTAAETVMIGVQHF